ncbi:MAG: phosphotransferase [Candidatus Zixiibacteriota bacterium]|nr:MAG: phosphotransferase [candidate division Zixibacteria bacterium]
MGQTTRLGRIRRFQKLAQQALPLFGLKDARLTFLAYEGNAIYRVDLPRRKTAGSSGNLFAPGRFVLRVHMDYHSTAAIESELQWLSALRRDIDAPVPEPVPAEDGNLVVELPIPGQEEMRRKCSVLRWLDGRFISKRLTDRHIRAWGRLMAQLHEHASQWRFSEGFTRPRRDWDGLFSNAARFEFPASELWQAIPDEYRKCFRAVIDDLKAAMNELGLGPEVFGLVHADLDINTNVLFKGGEARVIDFDDCCLAYWLHDLAFALSPWQGTKRESQIRDTFLEGYSVIRTLPQSQLRYLDLFIAGFNANLMLWMIDWARLRPDSPEPGKHIRKYGDNMLRYLDPR